MTLVPNTTCKESECLSFVPPEASVELTYSTGKNEEEERGCNSYSDHALSVNYA